MRKKANAAKPATTTETNEAIEQMYCGVSEAQIAKWKKEHGELHLIEVVDPSDSDKKYHLIVKKLGLSAISAAAKYVESDPFKAAEIMLANAKLACDPEIEAKDELKAGVFPQLQKLFKVAKSSIVKL